MPHKETKPSLSTLLKKYYCYDSSRDRITSLGLHSFIDVVATQKLPKRIRRGNCSFHCPRIKNVNLGDVIDIAILDPVLLPQSALVSKNRKNFPNDVRILVDAIDDPKIAPLKWWQFQLSNELGGGFIFIDHQNLTRLKNIF